MKKTKKVIISLMFVLLIANLVPISYSLNSISVSGPDDGMDLWCFSRDIANDYFSDWFGEPSLSTLASYDELVTYLSNNPDITAYSAVGHGSAYSFMLKDGTYLTASRLPQIMLEREPFHFVLMSHCGGLDSYCSGTMAYALVKGDFENSIVAGTHHITTAGDEYTPTQRVYEAFNTRNQFMYMCDTNRNMTFGDIYEHLNNSINTSLGCRYFRVVGNLSLCLNDIIAMHNYQSPQYNITVISPNGNETYGNGDVMTIEWNSTGTSNLLCELYMECQSWKRIAVLPPSGTYQWTIDLHNMSPFYKCFKIKLTSEDGLYDFSDDLFTINRLSSNITYFINITAPHGGESWEVGETYSINWSTNVINYTVVMFLFKGNNVVNFYYIPNKGYYNYTVPFDMIVGSDYKIAISDKFGFSGCAIDYSDDYFSIKLSYTDGDINEDGRVNVLDMLLIGQHWMQSGTPGWIPEDINKDGHVNVLDLVIMGQHWTG